MQVTAADALAYVPMLAGLERKQLERLARDFTERVFTAGSTVVKQGDEHGIGFFVIAEGEASVEVDGEEVARLRAGDHFGEIALIGDRVRTATVTAVTDLRCFVMTIWEFRAFVQGDAEVAWRLLEHIAALIQLRELQAASR